MFKFSAEELGVTFKGADVRIQTPEKFKEEHAQRMLDANYRAQQEQLLKAKIEILKQNLNQERGDRISTDTAANKLAIPGQYQPKAGAPRLPHYVTPERLKNMGFTLDIINILNPQSTPIAYDEAAKRNEEARKKFEDKSENKGKTFITIYHPDKRIVKGESDPKGGAKLVRFHERQEVPEAPFHASPQEMKQKIEAEMNKGIGNFNITATVKRVLDLSTEPNYASEAELQAGNYNVELSFTFSGSQQAKIKPENNDGSKNVEYKKTSSIKSALDWLLGREP